MFAEFAAWAPLLQGTPVLAREEFHWRADQSKWPSAPSSLGCSGRASEPARLRSRSLLSRRGLARPC